MIEKYISHIFIPEGHEVIVIDYDKKEMNPLRYCHFQEWKQWISKIRNVFNKVFGVFMI